MKEQIINWSGMLSFISAATNTLWNVGQLCIWSHSTQYPWALQFLLFPHGVDVWGLGEGTQRVSVRVLIVVTAPPPHFSLPCSLSFLTSSTHCVFPALFWLLAGVGEHQLLHYIDGESSPTHINTHIHWNYIALWKSHSDLVILVMQGNGVFPGATVAKNTLWCLINVDESRYQTSWRAVTNPFDTNQAPTSLTKDPKYIIYHRPHLRGLCSRH